MGDSSLPFGAPSFIPGINAETGEFIPGSLSTGAREFTPTFGSAPNSMMAGMNMSAGSAEFVPSMYHVGNNVLSGELAPEAQEFVPTGAEFIPGRGLTFTPLQPTEFIPNAGEFIPQAPEFQPSMGEYGDGGMYGGEEDAGGEGYEMMMGGDYNEGMEEAEMMMPVYGPREGGWAEVCATTVAGSIEQAMNQPSSIVCLAFDPLYEQVCACTCDSVHGSTQIYSIQSRTLSPLFHIFTVQTSIETQDSSDKHTPPTWSHILHPPLHDREENKPHENALA
jgi:hypothetical protein